VKKVFPVAVGRDRTPSRSGSFRIVNRVTKPTYYHKSKVIASGPVNPLGTRWMGLSEHGYGIHGTNVPSSIGKAASHGCVRMARADLEQFFELVTPAAMAFPGTTPRLPLSPPRYSAVMWNPQAPENPVTLSEPWRGAPGRLWFTFSA
jgi:L,D-transpeptidase catalytic domain